jgi:DUF1365 family protein
MVRIIRGVVLHKRRAPFTHALKFANYMWEIELTKPLPAFVARRLKPADHFGGEAPSVLEAVKTFAASAEENVRPDDRVVMVTSLRTTGYVFNPLSVYWCYGSDGVCRWAIMEIHNTYGDRHAHVIHPDAQGKAKVSKEFYVSPFFTIDGEYETRTSIDGDNVVLVVNLFQNNEFVFSASFTGKAKEASQLNRLFAVIRTPFSTLQAMTRIRIHGIWLWLRRLPVIARPIHPTQIGMQ